MAMMNPNNNNNNNKTICVVLGGRSFIGKPLVSMLLKSKKWIVRIADSDPCLNLDLVENTSILSESISSGIASYFQLDLLDKSQIIKAVQGSTVVYHTGATGFSSKGFYDQYITNVQGTKNVIHACHECKVKRLIYTSSADVVFDGIHDVLNGNESLPYPERFGDTLSDLKAQAEALVLFANRSDELLTTVLRPSNVFGPGDVKLVPFLLRAAKSGLAKFIVGTGENVCDFTYVDNVAHAHVCAEEALRARTAFVAGKAFFITNLDPMKFWDFVSLIFEGLGYPRPRFKVPAKLFLFVAVLSNWLHEKLEQRDAHSVLTPTIVHQLSCSMTFNCSEAQNHIGYSPIVSLQEGVTFTIESFSHAAEDSVEFRYEDCNELSKADIFLGHGRVADILLWRDEKKTFTYFLGLVLLFYWFFLSGRTFVSSAAKLLLLISVVLFSHGILPASVFGFTVKKISPSHVEVTEKVTDAIMYLASAWNHCMRTLSLLAQGGDWNIFLKVMCTLYVLKLLLSLSFSAVTGVALAFAFTAFFIYMQYEDKVDRVTEFSSTGIKSLKMFLLRNVPVSVASLLDKSEIMGPKE